MYLIDKDTRVLVQGITGHQGAFHSGEMLKFGTRVVAGVTPGKSGSEVHGVPVYDSVEDAMVQKPTVSMIAVPARFVKEAVFEALEAGISLVYVLTEGVPAHITMELVHHASRFNARLLGPNSPGVTVAGASKLGIMPNHIFSEGSIGVVSRSGTLTYEVVRAITDRGLGETMVVGIGGDAIIGTSMVDVVKMLNEDSRTKGIALIGEIGGSAEEITSEYIRDNVDKPVVAYIAGKTAPKEKRMGHAGAIVYENTGTVDSKVKHLTSAGAVVVEYPWEIADKLHELV